ncbi:hypothetical protein [Curtobacterium sp. MCBD17_040]|uniref:hypothetical protein n=1 Tax=Curtobacterium sp. MCBD17_040 TaxID=2175674 RepID=UPI0011B694DB|nr:hypothetical protein [Curtobacterium sp. MCBD17_040]WIB65912.1 hypothetical protein DEI94_17505 [Curtobacterium sp. MCBD17_040]
MPEPQTVEVILFKQSGKYYTTDFWRVPEQHAEGPVSMRNSPDYRNIDGPVLIPENNLWGAPAPAHRRDRRGTDVEHHPKRAPPRRRRTATTRHRAVPAGRGSQRVNGHEDWRRKPLLDQMNLAVETLQRIRAGSSGGTWYGADETMHDDNHNRVQTANLVRNGWDIVTCHGGDVPPTDGSHDVRAATAVADRDLIQITAGNPALLDIIEQTITDARSAILNAIDLLGGALGSDTIWKHEPALIAAQSILALHYTPVEYQYDRQPPFGVEAALSCP